MQWGLSVWAGHFGAQFQGQIAWWEAVLFVLVLRLFGAPVVDLPSLETVLAWYRHAINQFTQYE